MRLARTCAGGKAAMGVEAEPSRMTAPVGAGKTADFVELRTSPARYSAGASCP